MKRLLVGLAAMALSILGASGASAAPSKKAFVAEMKRRLEAQLGAKLTPIPGDPLGLRRAGSTKAEEKHFYLYRIFSFCQEADAAECERAKEDYVRNLTQPVPDPTAESLRLVVRDADYLAGALEIGLDSESQPFVIYEQIGEDLYAMLASDSPEMITMLGGKSLSKLNLTRAEAWKRAREQTRAALPALPTAAQLREGGVVFEGHDYGATLLADTAAWRRLARSVGPDLFVTAVSDGFIFVGRIPDGAGLEAFAKTVVEDCKHQDGCLSPHVYRFREGRWVVAR